MCAVGGESKAEGEGEGGAMDTGGVGEGEGDSEQAGALVEPRNMEGVSESSIITYDNGFKYEGEVTDGKPNGRGIWTSANGNTIDGEWKDGVLHGKGRNATTKGVTFEFDYKDKRNAEGRNFSNVSINGQPVSAEGGFLRQIRRKVGVGAGAGAGEGKGEAQMDESEDEIDDIGDFLD